MTQEYAFYIWASYGLAAAVLLWLLLSSLRMVKQSEKRLKELQSAVAPASEGAAKDAA